MYVIMKRKSKMFLSYATVHTDKNNNVINVLSHQDQRSWNKDINRAKTFSMLSSNEQSDENVVPQLTNLRNSLVRYLREVFPDEDVVAYGITINLV